MSGSPLKILFKTVPERRRVTVDYGCYLDAAEKVVDVRYTVTPFTTGDALVIDSSFADATQRKVVLFASGGKANTSYIVELLARTDATRVKEDNIGFKVTP